MVKVLHFEATLTIEDDGAYIGDNDQQRHAFWAQVNEHSVLHVNGDIGEGVGIFSDVWVSPVEK